MTTRYIHTPENARIWGEIDDLMLQVDSRSPTPKVKCILLVGEPDSGKTTLLRQFKYAYLKNLQKAKNTDIRLFRLMSRTLLKGMAAGLCRELKIPDVPEKLGSNWTTSVLINKAAKKLFYDKSMLLIVDEFQKLLKIHGDRRDEILEGFNDLLNESHVPMVVAGVNGVEEILNIPESADIANLWGTFCSRFIEIKLNPWNDPHDNNFIAFLATIYDEFNLCPPPDTKPFYMYDKIRELIIKLTDGLTGSIITLLKWTAKDLIRHGHSEVITADLLKKTSEKIQKRRLK